MGVDVFTRITLGAGLTVFESGFMYTSLFAYFASAVTASIVSGHDVDQTVNTSGIVLSQASGILQCIMDSALTKRMQPGFAASAAVQAAQFTDIGLTGCKEILDLTAKVHPYIDEEIEKNYGGCAPTRVKVHTTRGDFEDCVVIPKGSPENPMTMDEILNKLQGTRDFAACPVKEGAFEKIVELVRNLENCENVNVLLDALHNGFVVE